MDRYRMKVILRKITDALAPILSKDTVIFCFFLILSFAFWVLQTLNETLEKDIVVPVVVTDVPADVVIITPPPATITVRVRDKGTALFRYWRHSVDTLRINFPIYDTGGLSGTTKLNATELQKLVQDGLLASTKIQSVKPESLEFCYNHGLSKKVPVVVTGVAETDQQHFLASIAALPTRVTVYASESVLDTLKAVYTMPISLTDLRESTTCNVRLRTTRGMSCQPEEVKVNVTVDRYVDNTVEVPITSSNFPADKSLRVFPSTVKVTYTMGFNEAKQVNADDFVILVTYDNILELQRDGKQYIPLTLKTKPDNVKSYRISPSEVDYLLETVDTED